MSFTQVSDRPAAVGPRFNRVRHPPRVRALQVLRVEAVTAAMLRVTLGGEDLHDFRSTGFDDHVKVLIPTERGTEARDYTPRRFDPVRRELVIDFAVHDAGPATRWASGPRPGDVVQVAGPKKSALTPADVRRWLLIGDETALPAIGRCIEEAAPGVEITSVIAVAGPQEEQAFETQARLISRWAHRPPQEADQPDSLIAILEELEVAPDTFVWIAAEARVARNLRGYLADVHAQPPGWIKAGGYWVKGQADAHERIG